MPHDVIMPALGMAQDTGLLLAWHKKPGDPVAEGDVLFEVETDKAAMEVQAQNAGYLTDISAEAGTDVPVGETIALISDTPAGSGTRGSTDGKSSAPPTEAAAGVVGSAIDGEKVIMPALGMAQDTGLIISWSKSPGDAVTANDVLLEVETDKSTMEVPAGYDGYVAAIYADAGENIPVGDVIAVISAEKPDTPVSQFHKPTQSAATAADAESAAGSDTTPATVQKTRPAGGIARPAPVSETGKILASPKAKRLAREQGLDLGRLARSGVEQPFHVADLETLKNLPTETAPANLPTGSGSRRITAEVPVAGLSEFLSWLASERGSTVRRDTVLASFAAAVLRSGRPDQDIIVQTEVPSGARTHANPDLTWISGTEPAANTAAPSLIIRDLSGTPVTSIQLGGDIVPVLSLSRSGETYMITCECTGAALSATEALTLTTGFAERVATPLRHLL